MVVEDVEVVAVGNALCGIPGMRTGAGNATEGVPYKNALHIHRLPGVGGRQLPAEHSLGILRVALRVAAAAAVEENAAAGRPAQAGVSELQPELRLADAGCADNHGQRAGNQSAAEQLIQSGHARRLPCRQGSESRDSGHAQWQCGIAKTARPLACLHKRAHLPPTIRTSVLSENSVSVPSLYTSSPSSAA